MYRHGPTCLEGPVSRWSPWWLCSFPQAAQPKERAHTAPKAANADPTDNAASGEPPIRRELVERMRREIAAGSYETPEKLESALEKLLQRLNQES